MQHTKTIQEKSIDEVKEEIKSFLDNDLKSDSIYEIESKIGKIINGHLRITYKVNPQALIRGRKNYNGEVFTTNKDLEHPRWDEIPKEKHKIGRCNDKGESIFYASTETDTTICELQLENNEFFTLGEFISREPKLDAICQVIGVRDLSKSRKTYKKLFEQHYLKLKKDSPDDYEKNLLIDEFLTNQFTQIVSDSDEWKYKVTIAVTHILLSNPDTDGLIYPSIAANAKGVNYALRPKIVEANLRLIRAGMFQSLVSNSKKKPYVRKMFTPSIDETKELKVIKWKPTNLEANDEFEVECG